jgi:hypothetical protein
MVIAQKLSQITRASDPSALRISFNPTRHATTAERTDWQDMEGNSASLRKFQVIIRHALAVHAAMFHACSQHTEEWVVLEEGGGTGESPRIHFKKSVRGFATSVTACQGCGLCFHIWKSITTSKGIRTPRTLARQATPKLLARRWLELRERLGLLSVVVFSVACEQQSLLLLTHLHQSIEGLG